MHKRNLLCTHRRDQDAVLVRRADLAGPAVGSGVTEVAAAACVDGGACRRAGVRRARVAEAHAVRALRCRVRVRGARLTGLGRGRGEGAPAALHALLWQIRAGFREVPPRGAHTMATLEEKFKAVMTKFWDAAGADPAEGIDRQQLRNHAIFVTTFGDKVSLVKMIDSDVESDEEIDPGHLEDERVMGVIDKYVDRLFAQTRVDSNEDGKISQDEIWAFIKDIPAFEAMTVTKEEEDVFLGQMEELVRVLAGIKKKPGTERFDEVKSKLKSAFDAADTNKNGVLDKDEMKAACMRMGESLATTYAAMGVCSSKDEIINQVDTGVDEMTAHIVDDDGNVTFDAMFQQFTDKVCNGEDPATYFEEMPPTMFAVINQHMDMYLGGLLEKEVS